MKRWMTSVAAALLLGATFGRAAAGPMIDWDPAYFWQVGATPYNSPFGGELKCVGIVSAFDTPLQFLNPILPTEEYTFYVYGLISQGTTTSGPPAYEFYDTAYNGGFIELYYDNSPDSFFDPNPPNANVPSKYTDGTLLLSGFFTSFFTQTNNFTAFNIGNAEGSVTWTGGTLLPYMNGGNGEPCPGLFTGGMTWRPTVMIPGYLFRHDGKLDFNCPTRSRAGTWGAIKTLYR